MIFKVKEIALMQICVLIPRRESLPN